MQHPSRSLQTDPQAAQRFTPRLTWLAVGIAVTALAGAAFVLPRPAQSETAPVATAPALAVFHVNDKAAVSATACDGVVEAVRSTSMSAQVAGAVVQIDVKAGDRVKAGQLLMRIDARAADQSALASAAQVDVARAQLDVATRDVERQRQLFAQQFISRAALDHAEAQFQAARAVLDAQLAQAGVARTQTAFHLVRAPFAGVIADVPVTLGDMAMPGRPLITVYDPTALRVSVAVPQSLMAKLGAGLTPDALRIELPGLSGADTRVKPVRVVALPTVDAATHTSTLRADLPTGLADVTPGLFARAWVQLPAASRGAVAGPPAGQISVPTSALVRRAEMTALYVVDGRGRPLLRQVRLGRTLGEQVEVLAGLSVGEAVASDPHAAARIR